ncbi:MAG: STN domain-containing protein, partial [Marinifilum sp.]|nr:STN domain-containing protein [Marinifilum sp.]
MKLTVLFMMLGLLQVSASGYSQNAVFSISSKSISLQELFEKIEKTSEYKFFYNNNNVETDTEVRLDCKDQAIDEILDAVLEELPYSYKMLENNLILIHQKESQEKSGVQEIEKRTITGKVVDKAGM